MKTDLFQCGHCWVFQICLYIECSTFTASSFRIWNSSTGIPSPPQALFIVMLSKAHLTLHSRMSGSRWVITPSWLFGSWRSFLYNSSVYSWHLFLISSASVRSVPFLFFIVPIFAWNVPLASLIFLKRYLVFPILLSSSVSLHWSWRKTFWSLLVILWHSAFKWVYLSFSPLPFASLFFSAIFKACSGNHFAFLHIFFLGMILITASYTMSRTSVHSSSGTLSNSGNVLEAEWSLFLVKKKKWVSLRILCSGTHRVNYWVFCLIAISGDLTELRPWIAWASMGMDSLTSSVKAPVARSYSRQCKWDFIRDI